jgi:hypothetical protein
MKTRLFSATAISAVLLGAILISRLLAEDSQPSRAHEYATIRWAGRDNTHIIRPGGQVEFVGGELRKATRPDRADDRAFYMNVVMNGLTKEGYRFVGMTSDEIVMERQVR